MISTLTKLSKKEVPEKPQALAHKICLGKAVGLPGEREADHFLLKHLLLFSSMLIVFYSFIYHFYCFCFCCRVSPSISNSNAFEGRGARLTTLSANNRGTFNDYLNYREFMWRTFQMNEMQICFKKCHTLYSQTILFHDSTESKSFIKILRV